MKYFTFLLPVLFLSFSSAALGQYYDTGQDPSSLRWTQIKTKHFRIIYPRSYGEEGIKFARSLDKAYLDLSARYPGVRFRIPVIIHNYTTQSNGYVAWAPSRMEIYPTPDQNSLPLDPDRQLALHELTHVMQLASLQKGFTKVMSYVTGQQFPGIVSSLLPLWYLEGDAVFSESLFTQSGRGRSPSFQKELKAISLEKGSMYKYDKAVNGSYRDFVPDYYQTGYQTVAWSYYKYGPEVWRKALKTTAQIPFSVNPVNISLLRNESITKRILYDVTFDTLRAVWRLDESNSGYKPSKVLNRDKKGRYTDYVSPVFAGTDSIIAVKNTLSGPPVFVLITGKAGTEKRIHTPGYGYPWYLTFGAGKLVWTETRTDPRWENRTWSVIKIMDIEHKTTRKVSSRSRFMSAAISGDGKYIAASENTAGNHNSLVIVNPESGSVIEKIPSPGNAYLQRPRWQGNGRKIVVISLTEAGEGILLYDLNGKKWETLIEAGSNDIQSAVVAHDSLMFVSSASGTDNVYLRTPDGKIGLLTKSRFGTSDLDLHSNILLFSDYSSSGNNISTISLPEQKVSLRGHDYSASFLINRFEPAPAPTEEAQAPVYKPQPYRKWLHLLRFHSWMPFYADLQKIQSDPASIKPGLTIMTQNDLSTLISTLGYEYSGNRHQLHYDINWYGWYLVLQSRLDYGFIPAINKLGENVGPPASVNPGIRLTNTISLPLSFQGARFSQYLNISASSELQNDYNYIADRAVYNNRQNEITGRIYFSNFHRQALRDIYPRWGQVFDVSYSSYPSDKDLYGDILTAKSYFFLPGFLRNNGIRLRLEAEKQNPVRFVLGTRASFPRGIKEIIQKEIRFGSIDYFMPLFYPDLNISSLLYITRFRADLFHDFAWVPGKYVFTENNGVTSLDYLENPETFRSYGIELMSDFYLFRMPFEMSAGLQAAWQQFDKAPVLRLLFNINVFGMSVGKAALRSP